MKPLQYYKKQIFIMGCLGMFPMLVFAQETLSSANGLHGDYSGSRVEHSDHHPKNILHNGAPSFSRLPFEEQKVHQCSMKRTIFLFFLFFCTHSFAQKVAIKNNLAYDALKTPNLSLEFSMGRKWTLDTQVGMNFFFYTQDATSSRYKTKKASHWLVQPELRYWTCDVFNGWFFHLLCKRMGAKK